MIYNRAVQTRSLYIHWPFCAYKCHFCPFVALASHEPFMDQYNNALDKEIEQFASLGANNAEIETIFIGGGTPSSWPDKLLLDTSGKMRSVYCVNDSAEITIEVNPGTVRQEQLKMWTDIGINRLSIGIQSLNDSVLKKLNRLHTAKDVRTVLEQAKKNFENISIDLILGLPDISEDEWKKTLREVIYWPIKHISIYFLTVHENTKLYFHVESQKVVLPADDSLVDLYSWSVDFLNKHGFVQYEISNFARSGYRCKHNQVYWNRKPYKGFGLGACSFDGTSRFQNSKNLMDYIQAIESGGNSADFVETLSVKQVILEKLMLGLRRPKGMRSIEFFEDLSETQVRRIEKNISFLKDKKFIKEINGMLCLNPNYIMLENEIVINILDGVV